MLASRSSWARPVYGRTSRASSTAGGCCAEFAVEPSDRTLTVYTRSLGAGKTDVRLVLSVDHTDRMARRHACLSVVEFLHAR